MVIWIRVICRNRYSAQTIGFGRNSILGENTISRSLIAIELYHPMEMIVFFDRFRAVTLRLHLEVLRSVFLDYIHQTDTSISTLKIHLY